ncbi:GAF domain-containing sensor histidine kinase [Planococcus shenhongbingii]|uniref:histidine kinase n=1 Tax=Planococcus shenhongbingii TaxID=3058398 RepID=A0ABT8NGJ9_9BACL|nr:GAF domain-containing protein [Planococcus sp. N017]MDN7247021.1 GAF domain-containing protein [Planococcus sp. N017]
MLKEQTRYSRLANITKVINTKLELREVLQHVTTAISEEIVQCNSVGIFLPHEDGSFRAFVGKPEFINGNSFDSQVLDLEMDLLANEVIETQKTIYIPDTSKDHRPDPRSVEAFEIKSLLGLPISFEQELFGLVFLFDHGAPMNLTESEIQSVEAYVNMAAVAIQNAKNLAQKENLIAENQMLLNISRELSMCSSIQESIDKCFFYLSKVLGSDNMVAHLLDPLNKKNISLTKCSEGCTWEEADCMGDPRNMQMDQGYDSLIQKVIQSRKAMTVPCLASKNLLIIPLVSMKEVLGVITVLNRDGENSNYDTSQIQLAQSIVDTTAPTFSNLLYMDQLENMVEERTSALAAANEKVTSVIESITDGFFALNKEWEIIYINKHQYLPDNKKPKEVLGKNIWDVIPPHTAEIMYDEFHRAMFERIPVQFEIPSLNEDSWYEVVAYPFDDGICCLFKDIAEKRKYENELKRLSKLDLIGQMAAGISHEIRNPMTTVRGFLQLLKHEEDLNRHFSYFDLMIDELDRANSIITEFLSMGNTRSSDLKMMDLNSLISDIAPLIKIDTFNQNKLIEFNTQEIPEMLMNRNEIRQLIINLCRNGLEAMNEGNVLTISTYQNEAGCVVLAIQDEGEGILPEVLEKVGTPFYTTKDNGTGLGLGISYAIAARHNATIDIETGPGGTTFYTTFCNRGEK